MVLRLKSDMVGMVSVTLCLVHCVATPFLFLSRAVFYTKELPYWWQQLDYLFLVISFFAIYNAAKSTSKRWVATSLWIVWGVLVFTISQETFETGLLPEEFIYVPSLLMVALHFYNLKFCQCRNTACCVHQ